VCALAQSSLFCLDMTPVRLQNQEAIAGVLFSLGKAGGLDEAAEYAQVRVLRPLPSWPSLFIRV